MTNIPKIVIANDHAALDLKQKVVAQLEAKGFEVLNLGTDTEDSVDYPDYADKLAEAIKQGEAALGVLICGSGIGISIAANRHKHIRAALCHSVETATLSRQHNNANVLVLGGRVTPESVCLACVEAFFTTEFEGGRHERRVEKMS
jgi:ribose 5-phosphate isomerase B